jgi:hypothetical protein
MLSIFFPLAGCLSSEELSSNIGATSEGGTSTGDVNAMLVDVNRTTPSRMIGITALSYKTRVWSLIVTNLCEID